MEYWSYRVATIVPMYSMNALCCLAQWQGKKNCVPSVFALALEQHIAAEETTAYSGLMTGRVKTGT